MSSHVHRVVNHLKYWRSNWTLMASSFILALSGVLVAGTIARAGTNALACGQQCGGYGGYTNGYQGDNGGYGYGGNGNYGGYGSTAGYQGGYPPGALCNSGYYPAGSCGVNGLYDGTEPNLGNYNGPPGGYNNPDNSSNFTPQPSPEQPAPQPQPSPSESPAPAPVNNNENNNSSTNTATANVIVNPGVTTASTVRQVAPAPSAALVLPETGPTDNAIKLAGIGGLVAASVAYISSRRELLRTVFRK